MNLLFGIIASYILGAIPNAYIVGKLVKNIDIRTCGSGNVGATNVFRSVGKRWGFLVLFLDMLKGLIAVIVFSRFCSVDFIDIKSVQCMYGIASVSGHNWTIFLGFKGGKGVATTCGMVLGLFPPALGLSVLVFVIIVAITRYVSLGSIVASSVFPLFVWVFYRAHSGFPFFLVFAVLMVVFIVYRHKANIQRLLQGTENKITFKK